MSFEGENLEMKKEREGKPEEWQEYLLTHEEYKNHPYIEDEPDPTYTFELSSGDKKLYYFGSSHTNDPENPVFDQIEDEFNRVSPDKVLVEGWRAINENEYRVREGMKERTRRDMKHRGEPHFTVKLAAEAGIDFESPEPLLSEEIAYLENQGFSQKDIFRWYVYRQVHQYQRKHNQRSPEECKEYLIPHIVNLQESSGWNQAKIDKFKNDIFYELDVDDAELYRDRVDPVPWNGNQQTVLNEIARGSSNFRDKYILERIKESLDNHDSIFVVYGLTHAVRQEPALRALFQGEELKS